MIFLNNLKFLEISNNLVTNAFGFNAWEIWELTLTHISCIQGECETFYINRFMASYNSTREAWALHLALKEYAANIQVFHKSPLIFLSCQLTNQFVEIFSMFWI